MSAIKTLLACCSVLALPVSVWTFSQMRSLENKIEAASAHQQEVNADLFDRGNRLRRYRIDPMGESVSLLARELGYEFKMIPEQESRWVVERRK
jgi:hypothetical protein